MRKSLSAIFVLSAVFIFCIEAGCKKSGNAASNAAEQAALEEERAAADAAQQAEQKPPAPAPKMNDDVYVEITARSALIRDKYKEDEDQAQREIDAVYEKFGVTFNEYKDFQGKLTPQHSGEVQRKISDFMQKIAGEYR